MPAIGDICELPGLKQPGRWVVTRIDRGAPIAPRYHVAQERLGRRWGLDAGEGNVSVVKAVAFTPGQAIRFGGRPAEVIEDKPAEGLVAISYINPRRPLSGGGALEATPGQCDAGRADLVLQNLKRVLED